MKAYASWRSTIRVARRKSESTRARTLLNRQDCPAKTKAVDLQLHAVAYKMANFLRTLALRDEKERRSLDGRGGGVAPPVPPHSGE